MHDLALNFSLPSLNAPLQNKLPKIYLTRSPLLSIVHLPLVQYLFVSEDAVSEHSRQPVGKERILEIAGQLFMARGYKAVSIRDIAQACGLTNAALYYYFPSKEALFHEVVQRHVNDLAQALKEARAQAAQGDLKAQLIAMIAVYTQWVTTDKASLFTMRRDVLYLARHASNKQERPFLQLMYAVVAPIEEILQEAVQQGIFRPSPIESPLSGLLLGMLHGLLHFKRSEPSSDSPKAEEHEAIARWVVDVFWQGMSASP